jgi:hypothetical protein
MKEEHERDAKARRRAENKREQWLSGICDAVRRTSDAKAAEVAAIVGEPTTAEQKDREVAAAMSSAHDEPEAEEPEIYGPTGQACFGIVGNDPSGATPDEHFDALLSVAEAHDALAVRVRHVERLASGSLKREARRVEKDLADP